MDYKNKRYFKYIKENSHLFSDEELLQAKRMKKLAKYKAKQEQEKKSNELTTHKGL